MHLTVARDKDGETGLLALPIEDITFLEFERFDNRINVHTLSDVYYIMGTLKFWVTALQSSGFDFVMVDRMNAANLNRIVRMDKQFNKAYFEADLTKESKGCTVAWNKFNLLEKRLKSINHSIIVT